MSLELILISYLELLKSDKNRIKDLQSQLAKNNADGKLTARLYKDLVSAQEKQVKHLKEYQKWFNENQKEVEPLLDRNNHSDSELQPPHKNEVNNDVPEEQTDSSQDDSCHSNPQRLRNDIDPRSLNTKLLPNQTNKKQKLKPQSAKKSKSRKKRNRNYKLRPKAS